MSKVEAVIFDFDNTLAGTSKLEKARTSRDKDLLRQLVPEVKLFQKSLYLLKEIKEQGLPIAIVTNSPKWYLEILLEHFELAEYFNVMITYDDVGSGGIKPNPEGINLACKMLNVTDKSNVLYIGDQSSDIEAAYAAGVVPLAPTWAKTKIRQMPTSVVCSNELILNLKAPSKLKLLADVAAENQSVKFEKGEKYYFAPLNMDGEVVMPGRDKLEIVTFGRYFSNKSTVTSRLRAAHKLSLEISQKDERAYQAEYEVPEYWIDLFIFILERLGRFIFRGKDNFDIITVIPAKPKRPKRLESMLLKIRENSDLDFEFLPDLFSFNEGAKSLKTLGSAAKRRQEVSNNLRLNEEQKDRIKGKKVLVIDDVMTTGATFKRAKELLEEEGISRFIGVTLAKTVFSIGSQKTCPSCQRFMRVLTNHDSGCRFWGCSGFYEKIDACSETALYNVKPCPQCNKDLFMRSGKYGLFLSHDCKTQGNDCSYTEKYEENVE